MKLFLLGMLTMYLGTSIVALLVGTLTEMFESDFLEMVFMFPFLVIVKGFQYIRTMFMPGCWYLMFCGINPFCMTFGRVCEKLNDDQLRKFVRLSAKKDQKKIRKILKSFKGYDIMNTESEV